jgi:hypothetical protein
MDPLEERVIADAVATIGVREIGFTNTGPEVNQYLQFVGLAPGDPWCAAYVCFRIYKAAHEVGVDITKWIKSGSAEALYLNAKQKGLLIDTPQPGCVFFEYFPAMNRYAHTGFVRSVSAGNTFSTVEGNSNTDGAREGYEVCSNARIVMAGKYAFARIE